MKTDIAYIYILLDPRDNYVRYVGKTVSPKSRLITHISESKKSNHHRANWIKMLSKIGLKPILKVVKICPLSEFEKYESEYIKLYKSKKLTNSDESGHGNGNRRKSIINKQASKISKVVYQYDLNGNFLNEYKSTREAGRKLNISHGNITRSCNGISKHTGGFIFSYNKNVDILPVLNPNAIKKSVIEIDKNDNEINRWVSIMDCSREINIDGGNLSRVCNGLNKSIKGRYFKFL